MTILPEDDLRTVAFKVCSALGETGVTAVLTGGSAATVYAPEAYQSRDLDFVLEFVDENPGVAEQALADLGYRPEAGQYVHDENPLTIDFLPRPIAIGSELIREWDTLFQDAMILHILSPTDCCRDRLAAFLHWNDRSSLAQAVAVASGHRVDMDVIRAWCERERHTERFGEFESEVGKGGSPQP